MVYGIQIKQEYFKMKWLDKGNNLLKNKVDIDK
jgi:hypothetical protein